MVDDEGNVKPEYAEDYYTMGVRDRDEQRLDLDRIEAFARDVVPLVKGWLEPAEADALFERLRTLVLGHGELRHLTPYLGHRILQCPFHFLCDHMFPERTGEMLGAASNDHTWR